MCSSDLTLCMIPILFNVLRCVFCGCEKTTVADFVTLGNRFSLGLSFLRKNLD